MRSLLLRTSSFGALCFAALLDACAAQRPAVSGESEEFLDNGCQPDMPKTSHACN